MPGTAFDVDFTPNDARTASGCESSSTLRRQDAEALRNKNTNDYIASLVNLLCALASLREHSHFNLN